VTAVENVVIAVENVAFGGGSGIRYHLLRLGGGRAAPVVEGRLGAAEVVSMTGVLIAVENVVLIATPRCQR
jgi:hypothetical protein